MNQPRQIKSIQSTVYPGPRPCYSEWNNEIHRHFEKSEPFHVPEDQERPFVEWPKTDPENDYTLLFVFVGVVVCGLIMYLAY